MYTHTESEKVNCLGFRVFGHALSQRFCAECHRHSAQIFCQPSVNSTTTPLNVHAASKKPERLGFRVAPTSLE